MAVTKLQVRKMIPTDDVGDMPTREGSETTVTTTVQI